jgi:hypothetical protein
MKLEEYSIDDLHLMALHEFDDDEDAQMVFNSIYEAMAKNYIAALKLLRLRYERKRSEAPVS